MGRSKVHRSMRLDGDVSRELDRLADTTGYSASALATQFIREGIRRREARLADSAVYAGLGTASMTALVVLSLLLG